MQVAVWYCNDDDDDDEVAQVAVLVWKWIREKQSSQSAVNMIVDFIFIVH